MNRMIIANLLISALLFFSCEKEARKTDISGQLLTKEILESSFIKLIPSVGIVLNSDSILIHKTHLIDLQSKVDTNSLSYKLTIDEPMQITMTTVDSPPPGYTGEYNHTPDRYFVDYLATLQFDQVTFCFYSSSEGKVPLSKNIYTENLKISSIRVSKPLQAGLFEDLKIGDAYENIFKHFEKPSYLNQLDEIRKEINYSGVIFTIETDKTKAGDYGRIIKIEINNLGVY